MSTLVHPTRDTLDQLLFDYLQRIRRLEGNVNRGHYQIKLFADENGADGNLPATVRIVSTGDGKFIFGIPDDLNNARLWDCFIYITTVGSAVLRVQIANLTQGYDFLTTRLEIEAGDTTSYQATTQKVINPTHPPVETGDLISIDVDNAGGGTAQGLGIGLEFNPPPAA